MDNEQAFPVIRQTVMVTTDPRRLAESYRQLFGLRYRPGDEPPGPAGRTRTRRPARTGPVQADRANLTYEPKTALCCFVPR